MVGYRRNGLASISVKFGYARVLCKMGGSRAINSKGICFSKSDRRYILPFSDLKGMFAGKKFSGNEEPIAEAVVYFEANVFFNIKIPRHYIYIPYIYSNTLYIIFIRISFLSVPFALPKASNFVSTTLKEYTEIQMRICPQGFLVQQVSCLNDNIYQMRP